MRISVGILGFGDKNRFLQLLLQLDSEPAIADICLFWNLAPADAISIVESLVHAHSKLRVRVDPVNHGSAGGYHALLSWFRDESSSELLLLLDDDARPEAGCVARLRSVAEQDVGFLDSTLLMAYRADLPEFPALRDADYAGVEPHPGVCVGVHLRNLFDPPRPVPSPRSDWSLLKSAPYGGLCIPRAALPRLGLPDRRLFLYGDDTALTLAFTRAGGRILLVTDAVIHDSEPAWNAVGGQVGNMTRRILYLDDRKAYYETRNRCYLGLTFYPGNRLVYGLNRLAFLTSAFIHALRHGRLERFLLIRRALHDGEAMARGESPARAIE